MTGFNVADMRALVLAKGWAVEFGVENGIADFYIPRVITGKPNLPSLDEWKDAVRSLAGSEGDASPS